MLQMPPIQRREIERLKPSRAIRIERTVPLAPITHDQPEPAVEERRFNPERRQRNVPVANDRRRTRGRRGQRKAINPQIRALLDNSENRPVETQGRFVDESV